MRRADLMSVSLAGALLSLLESESLTPPNVLVSKWPLFYTRSRPYKVDSRRGKMGGYELIWPEQKEKNHPVKEAWLNTAVRNTWLPLKNYGPAPILLSNGILTWDSRSRAAISPCWADYIPSHCGVVFQRAPPVGDLQHSPLWGIATALELWMIRLTYFTATKFPVTNASTLQSVR